MRKMNKNHMLIAMDIEKYFRALKSIYDREYLFEVGGKGKSFDQIKDEPKSYLAIDDIETIVPYCASAILIIFCSSDTWAYSIPLPCCSCCLEASFPKVTYD